MVEVFQFWINSISSVVNWVFRVEVIDEPKITLGMFLLGFAFIGLILYFILGSDFFPGHINLGNNSNSSRDNYVPRHSPGNAGKDFSTRESRYR